MSPVLRSAVFGTFGTTARAFTDTGSLRQVAAQMVGAGDFRLTTPPARWVSGSAEEEYMTLAYDFPLLGVFWSLFMFALFILWVFVVIWCFIDNFRRRDHHGLAKALWFLFIVFVPIIGVLAYIITRPADPYVVVTDV